MSSANRTPRVDWRIAVLPPILLLLALLLLAGLGLRLINVGASDLAVVGLFSTDEQLAGQLVRNMIQHGNLGLSHFYSYGPLDLYSARFWLWPWSILHRIPDQAIIVALRLVSLVAGLGCVAVTYLLGRHLWNAATGALAALMLALSPTVLAWSTTAHPDTLQLFWLLLGLLCALTLSARRSHLGLALGAIFAALAFASKYEGELLLPVLWLADFFGLLNGTPWRARAEPPAAALTAARDAALTLCIFATFFLLIDPSVLAEPRQFLYQARLEAGLAHSGHLFRAAAGGPSWLATLAAPNLLGPLLAALAIAGLLLWCARDLSVILRPPPAARRERDSLAGPQERLLLALWVAGYLLFLGVWIADRQPRYALPALPELCLFAAAGLVWLARRSPQAAVLAVVLVLAALATPAWNGLQYERAMAARMDNPLIRTRIAAGRWLAAQVPASTPIVADAYAYLPPSLIDVDVTFGLTRAQIAADHPLIIVTDAAIRDRFRDPSAAARYVDGPTSYDAIAETYAALSAGGFPCYPLLQDFGPERVYGRLPPGSAPSGC